jgi:Integrase zinc binding domain
MRWCLIIKEFGPKLTYIKGVNNVIADALSRMKMTEKDFGPDVFAGEKVKQKFPLSYKLLAEMQAKDKKLHKQLLSKDQTTYVYKMFRHSDKEYQLVTRDDRIVIPKSPERKATKRYHEHLLHPKETRLELMLKQHFTFIGLKPMCVKVCKACNICRTLKANQKKYSEVPPKVEQELIQWHMLCIDLIGPYSFGDKEKEPKKFIQLHCMTMIDPVTGWFEIVKVPTKRAPDYIANLLEFNWLSRYSWPT